MLESPACCIPRIRLLSDTTLIMRNDFISALPNHVSQSTATADAWCPFTRAAREMSPPGHVTPRLGSLWVVGSGQRAATASL